MGFALVDHSRRYLLSGWADRLSASISRELAHGNHCEVELAGPVSSPAHPPPPVNALALLTHGKPGTCGARKAVDDFFASRPETPIVFASTGQALVVRAAAASGRRSADPADRVPRA